MRVSRPAIVAGLVGLVATAALSSVAYVLDDHNETRLLNLQTKEAGAILQVVVPVVETPLSSAAQIAATSSGAKGPFTNYISAYVGAKGPFVSASLWRVAGDMATVITAVGAAPALPAAPGAAATFLATSAKRTTLQVTGPLAFSSGDRLGYAYAAPRAAVTWVVYAESALPPGRRAPQDSSSPLSDLHFALYLGTDRRREDLLETNADRLPITGRTSAVSVPFGSNSLTLVTTPTKSLGGALSASLWWIVAAGGTVLAVLAGVTAERLTRRRRAAEKLAAEVRDLLGKQRSIAETLQRALLPEELPELDGVDVAVRYVPGVHGLDIGGDWYDVVPLPEGRFFFVVGDVSGRGIRAGSVMASLRFAIRGFVSEGHPPEVVLDRIARMLLDSDGEHFATVLCGVADVRAHEIVLANAGHPPPLVGSDDGVDFVSMPIGPPVGVRRNADSADGYRPTTVRVAPRGTFIAYTDGLVERRGESLDVGLERLRSVATSGVGNAGDLVAVIVEQLVDEDADDDTAVLAVQWRD